MENLDIENLCNNLQSNERRDRQIALKKLINFCEESSESEIILLYEKCYLFILNCYYDKYENCRELACEIVNNFIEKLPANDFYLQYIIAVLSKRIGQKEIIENSEEMRLILLMQLTKLIKKFKQKSDYDPLFKCYDDIINILLRTLRDPYPSVLREASECVKTLADSTKSFHYRAETLVNPLLPIIHHKHSVNRVGAIEALGVIAIHITTNYDCVTKIISEISPLVMDTVPQVRLCCANVGCNLMLDLRDRYAHFQRILPLVLCGLSDESAEIRKEITAKWMKCGKQYFDENENELGKEEIVDYIPKNYPKNECRPSLGCRAIVQRCIQTVLSILRETSDWKEDVRLHSLKLLYQFVLHAEDMIAAKIIEVFAELPRACGDEETVVAKEALKVADLLGKLLKSQHWINHGIEKLKNNPKLGHLKCIYTMYKTSDDESEKYVLDVLKVISGRDYTNKLMPEFQKYLLMFTEECWNRHYHSKYSLLTSMHQLSLNDGPSTETDELIYQIILKVMALSIDDNFENENFRYAKNLLNSVAQGRKIPEKMLHNLHLKQLLETLEDLDAEIDDQNENTLILSGLIRICGFQKCYLCELKVCILAIWKHGTSQAIIKVLNSIAIAMLSWSKTIDCDIEESTSLLKEFINEIIADRIKWSAGSSSEAIRMMSTAVLSSLSQGAPLEAKQVLPNLAENFTSLIEDTNVATRVHALRCFMNFGPMSYMNLREIGQIILQRLDDPSSEVRLCAVRVLPNLELQDGESKNLDDWKNFLKEVLEAFLLHLEGPDLKLKRVLKDSIIILGAIHRDLFDSIYEDALKNSSSKEEIQSLQKAIHERCKINQTN